MRYWLVLLSVVAVAVMYAGYAFAADVLSQDDQSYDLVISSSAGEETVTIDAKGELRDICDSGCVIQMPDGQQQEVKSSDIVFIVDGQISLSD